MNDITKMKKGVFELKSNWKAPTDITMYQCSECKEKGIQHFIFEEAGPPARGNEYSFKGQATTIRICSACDKYDGPWVPAPY